MRGHPQRDGCHAAEKRDDLSRNAQIFGTKGGGQRKGEWGTDCNLGFEKKKHRRCERRSVQMVS